MNAKELILENFLSFKKLNLDLGGVKAIQGLNLDEKDQESNGSGKSAIFTGIEFCLFGSITRDVPITNLIKWGEVEAYSSLELYCPIRKSTLLIERKIAKNSSSKLSLIEDSESVDFSTVNDGNKFIIEWIGISKDDLQNYYIISKDRYNSFYKSSNTKKLEMISRFTNLDIIDGVEDTIKKQISQLRSNIIEKEKYLAVLVDRVEESKNLIIVENNRDYDSEYSIAESKLKLRIENLNSKIKIEEYSIKSNREELEELFNKSSIIKDEIELQQKYIYSLGEPDEIEQEVSGISDVIINIREFLQTQQKEKDLISLKLNSDRLKKEKLNTELDGAITCPKCKTSFLLGDRSIEDISAEVDILHSGIQSLNKEIKILTEGIDEIISDITVEEIKKREMQEVLDNFLEQYNKANKDLRILTGDFNENKSLLEDVKSLISASDRAISDNKESIKSIENQLLDLSVGEFNHTLVKSLEEKIDKSNEEIKIVNGEIEELEETIFNISNWKFNFKEFRSELSLDVLNLISAFTNKVLKSMGNDIEIEWKGFKVKSDGSISDKITAQVFRNGEKHMFGDFSGGERVKLEYANILASQYMINSTNKNGDFNFLITDEITEGLDPLGLSLLTKSLLKTNKDIILITHVMNIRNQENILLVTKENGNSRIDD